MIIYKKRYRDNLNRGNNIPDTTKKPSGLLEDLRAFTSTSKEHLGQLAKVSVIKKRRD